MPSGKAVVNLRVSTTDQWRDKQTGENKEATEWHNVVMFDRLAEIAAEYLRKGSQIYVEGENGTVFLISADDEAVLVAVASRGAKVGLMLFEVRRAAASVADALRVETAPSLVPVARVEHAPDNGTDEHAEDVPPLQFVTKNGWGQPENATTAENTSWT